MPATTTTTPFDNNGGRSRDGAGEVKRKVAEWPCRAEQKWEGDGRAKTECTRFPPLPREPGNGTVAWHKRRALVPYEFDRVRMVPSREDVERRARSGMLGAAAEMELESEVARRWVLGSLWEAIEGC